MTAPRLLAAVLLLTLALTGSAAAKNAPPPPAGAGDNLFGKTVVPGEVIVGYRAGVSGAARRDALGRAGASLKRRLLLANTELVAVKAGDERAAAAAIARDPDVEFAEPNGVVHGHAVSNDTRFADLWGLHNTGQTVNGFAGVADADIDATESWEIGRGLGATVRVADVDSGVPRNHPDLVSNMFTNPGESGGTKPTNGIDDDANGFIDDFRGWDFINDDNDPSDDHGHGAHTTGTIAARANNALGIAGAAAFPTPSGSWFGPKIVAVKVLNQFNSGSFADIVDGMVYAGQFGVKVANVSIGGPNTSTAVDNGIKSRPGTLYVISAGNSSSDNDTTPVTPCVPASLPDAANKICVAATDARDELASFSNFGDTHVDLAAPGVNTLSTQPNRLLFGDNLETALTGRWITNDAGQTPAAPRWARTTVFAGTPANSMTDSPGGTTAAPTQYVNSQDNWVRNATAFNFTGGTRCSASAFVRIDTELNFDFFTIEATTTPNVAASWQPKFTFSGGPAQGTASADLSAFDGMSNVFVRFRQRSDSSITDDGSYVDDVEVRCISNTFDASSYAFFQGTSMAAPHVSGTATFLFTRFPTATVAQVKDRILRSADRKASLTGDVVTGARLNQYKAAAESTAAVSGGILTVTAGAGQRNGFTATRFTDSDAVLKYRITDAYSASTVTPQRGSRIVPGAGCVRVTDTSVKCPIAGITRIALNGGDLDDTLSAGTIAIPVTLNGSTGADTLTGGTAGDIISGGTGVDRFTGGTGNDTIGARNEDVDALFSCGENAGDSDTVNADLSPNDPVTAATSNCEVVNKL